MCRATKDISEFPWMCMLDEPSLLIAESCCSKERFLYSYWKPLENLQTRNGDTSKSYCYMTKASCKTTHIICLTELKMNLYYLCVNIYLKMFLKSWRNIYKWTNIYKHPLIRMKEKFYFYSKLSRFFFFFFGVCTFNSGGTWTRLYFVLCRGPAPVDPGNLKWGWRRRESGNNCLIKC